MTTPNFPELKRLNLWVQAQDKLEPDERRWHQGWWITLRENEPICKTAFCVAGVAIVRAGNTFTYDYAEDAMRINGEYVKSEDVTERANKILGAEFNAEDEYSYADEEKLEMSLYASGNDAAAVDRIIRNVFAKHGVSYARTKAAPDKKIIIKSNEEVTPNK